MPNDVPPATGGVLPAGFWPTRGDEGCALVLPPPGACRHALGEKAAQISVTFTGDSKALAAMLAASLRLNRGGLR